MRQSVKLTSKTAASVGRFFFYFRLFQGGLVSDSEPQIPGARIRKERNYGRDYRDVGLAQTDVVASA